MARPIVILTDFGLSDVYAGVMKGVIQGIAPAAPVIDLCHEVMPQNVQQAAFMLLTSYQYFPLNTVFLIVVDPGVGTQRHPIVVKASGYYFIAPDNGVLSYILSMFASFEAHVLENAKYQLPGSSRTFHGRDIFAPAAAHLAAGIPMQELGGVLDSLVRLPMPFFERKADIIEGEVIHVDHFGNLITSIGTFKTVEDGQWILRPIWGGRECKLDAHKCKIVVGDETLSGVQEAYGHKGRDELLAVVGSSGFLEIAVNQGNAAAQLGIHLGTRVRVQQTGE